MKSIIATTAMTLMLSTAAFADNHMGKFSTYEAEQSGDIYASNFIGMRVYSAEKDFDSFNDDTRIEEGAEAEWDDIGEVNDVILGRDGKVKAVILGIGGFLGMGEKDVAVNMDSLKIVAEKDDEDDFFLVVSTNKEQLTEAPGFERDADDDMTAEKMDDQAAMKADDQVKTEEKTDDAAVVAVVPADKADDAANTRADNNARLMAPSVEREGYMTAKNEELTTENLTGARVYGVNDEDVGEVDKLILGDDKQISEAILDVGGFLGMGEHRIAVSMDQIQIIRNDNGDDVRVYIEATEEQLKALPAYEG